MSVTAFFSLKKNTHESVLAEFERSKNVFFPPQLMLLQIFRLALILLSSIDCFVNFLPVFTKLLYNAFDKNTSKGVARQQTHLNTVSTGDNVT
jgi:hypothetical protein